MASDMPPPSWAPIWLACKVCRHEWDDWQPIMVPAATWCAHARTIRCPSCGAGSGNVVLRTTPLKPSAKFTDPAR